MQRMKRRGLSGEPFGTPLRDWGCVRLQCIDTGTLYCIQHKICTGYGFCNYEKNKSTCFIDLWEQRMRSETMLTAEMSSCNSRKTCRTFRGNKLLKGDLHQRTCITLITCTCFILKFPTFVFFVQCKTAFIIRFNTFHWSSVNTVHT